MILLKCVALVALFLMALASTVWQTQRTDPEDAS